MPVQDIPQADFSRESAVPIHDDRDVMGDGGLLDLMQEPTFIRLIGGIADDLRDVCWHLRMLTNPDLFIHSGATFGLGRTARVRATFMGQTPVVAPHALHPQTFKYGA
jgi:hypothetical protein